ncbi:MAG: hypothetical protein LBD55_11920 [Treponema sp.]|jgi:hypothetical protein|nr:hypothetical protein [Treponema sp.]
MNSLFLSGDEENTRDLAAGCAFTLNPQAYFPVLSYPSALSAAGKVSVTAAVTGGKSADEDYTQEFDITLTDPLNPGIGSISITQETGVTESDLSVSGSWSSVITITGSAGYGVYEWRIDGTPRPGASGAALQVNAAAEGMTRGAHWVTLRVVKAGLSYSAAKSFTVAY